MSYSSVSGFDSESFSCSRLDTSFELGLAWRDKGRLEIQWGRRGESGNGHLAMFPLIPLPLRSNSLPGPSEWRKESGLYYSLTPALGCAPPRPAGGGWRKVSSGALRAGSPDWLSREGRGQGPPAFSWPEPRCAGLGFGNGFSASAWQLGAAWPRGRGQGGCRGPRAAPDWSGRLRTRTVSLADLTWRHRHCPLLSESFLRHPPDSAQAGLELGRGVPGSAGPKVPCPSTSSRFSFLAHLHPYPTSRFQPWGSRGPHL